MPLNVTNFSVEPEVGQNEHVIEHGLELDEYPVVQVVQNGYVVQVSTQFVDENTLRIVSNDQPQTVILYGNFDGRKAGAKKDA